MNTTERNSSDNEQMSDEVIDVGLMQGVVDRDEAALEQLFNRYRDAVYGMCLRILKNPSDAEETLVDVFMELWNRSERFDLERGKVSTYLLMLARSRAIDHLRSRASRRRLISHNGSEYLEQSGDLQNDPAEALSLAERRKMAHRALATLVPAQREAVHYAFFEGLSHREIAERLDLPLGTVKTRIRLGLIRFRDMLTNASREGTQHSADASSALRSSSDVESSRNDTPEKITSKQMVRVLLADDNDIFREGLAALLRNQPGIQVVGQARDGHAAVQLADVFQPDLVLMDIIMPGINGIEATRQILGKQSSMRVVGLSTHDQDEITNAMRAAGAEAYMNKDDPTEDLIATIHRPATRN
ncbi:sigma-70 family RNA polymerase sigma factor [Phycisphaerales bacterium AB-hyl4]|uniref:Sigma-70 family RNA polymerase sigma factor n=1 Tax=Natronomicrosphaera hydrolytica TaxID=3242702 RepID=A0ABV4U9S5_9BACT